MLCIPLISDLKLPSHPFLITGEFTEMETSILSASIAVGMVVHISNPSAQKEQVEDCYRFEANWHSKF